MFRPSAAAGGLMIVAGRLSQRIGAGDPAAFDQMPERVGNLDGRMCYVGGLFQQLRDCAGLQPGDSVDV